MKQKHYLIAFALLAATTIGTVYAGVSTAENDALAVVSANISLAQAVNTAEQYVGGKAARAEYESHRGHWLFDVEVVRDQTVTDVRVDGMSGKIIAVSLDTVDE